MDFDITEADEAFREEVRSFLRENLPSDIARKGHRGFHLSHADVSRWQKILYANGWAAPGWPQEQGGTGWTLMQRQIFEEECGIAGAPLGDTPTMVLLGPVLCKFGTGAQKERFLEPMKKGEETWCQGFSEPGSGSDLASLRTRADRDGDHYVINGSKIWTSNAHQTDWLFMLARTNHEVKKQAGISFLLVNMKTPGIRVRPLISIDGCHHLNETFYDNVRIPVENLVGEEGQGWAIAKWLLVNERVYGGADLPAVKKFLTRLKRLAGLEQSGDSPLIANRSFALRLAQLELEVLALEMAVLRVISDSSMANTGGSALGSILKIRGTELQQRLMELTLEAIGDYAPVLYLDPEALGTEKRLLPGPDHAAGIGAEYFYRRAASIYGGSNEIQRSIVSKILFGL